MGSQDVSASLPPLTSGPESWDPYDVWLTRVKQPRELQPRRTPVVEARSSADLRSGVDRDALLPGVS